LLAGKKTLSATAKSLEVVARGTLSLWSSVSDLTDPGREIRLVVESEEGVSSAEGRLVSVRFVDASGATIDGTESELPADAAMNLNRFTGLRVKTGVWGTVNDTLKRVRQGLGVWREAFNRTSVEDPVSFFGARLRNFGVFGAYADGNVLARNTEQKAQFMSFQNSLANLDDNAITCDAFDLATIVPDAAVVDQCDAVTAFKRGYKDQRSQRGLTDPAQEDKCYVFNEHIAEQITNGTFRTGEDSAAEAEVRSNRVRLAEASRSEASAAAGSVFGEYFSWVPGVASRRPPVVTRLD
jgi:hypothetical protein